MRSGVIGFVLGAAVVVLGLVVLQRIIVREVAPDLNYQFSTYVFPGTEFPPGDFEQGRVVHRCLFPVRVDRTFYDSQYRVVTQADKPGRYGALITIHLGGVVEHRYITLYRTEKMIFWWDDPWTASAELPPGTGVDPAVLKNQVLQIGAAFKHGFGDPDHSPDLAVLLAGLSETPPGNPPAVDRTSAVQRDSDWWFGLRKKLGLISQYPYLVDLPKGYDADAKKKWPVILYLHSNNECGTDLGKVRQSGLAKVVAEGKQIPVIVVSPVCPLYVGWSTPLLNELLDEVSTKYRVDPDRIYLTGASGGGDEVLNLALANPERFAAIMFVAGESDPNDAARLKSIPTWAFEGAKDDVVPPQNVVDMVEAIRKAGGQAHLTLYPDLEHNAWDRAFSLDDFYAWLLSQRRGQPEVRTPGTPQP